MRSCEPRSWPFQEAPEGCKEGLSARRPSQTAPCCSLQPRLVARRLLPQSIPKSFDWEVGAPQEPFPVWLREPGPCRVGPLGCVTVDS